jgi:hypothetical protein
MFSRVRTQIAAIPRAQMARIIHQRSEIVDRTSDKKLIIELSLRAEMNSG